MNVFQHDPHITTINLNLTEIAELKSILSEYSKLTANPWRTDFARLLMRRIRQAEKEAK